MDPPEETSQVTSPLLPPHQRRENGDVVIELPETRPVVALGSHSDPPGQTRRRRRPRGARRSVQVIEYHHHHHHVWPDAAAAAAAAATAATKQKGSDGETAGSMALPATSVDTEAFVTQAAAAAIGHDTLRAAGGTVPPFPAVPLQYLADGRGGVQVMPIGAGTLANPVDQLSFTLSNTQNNFTWILGCLICCPIAFCCVVLWLVLYGVIEWTDVFGNPW